MLYNYLGFSLDYAKESDCEEILNLIKEIAEYEKMSSCVTATKNVLYDSIFIKKRATVIMARLNDKVIGYLLYFYNFSTFTGTSNIYIEDIYLKKEYRNNGYGKIMLRILANIALKENALRIDWTCLNWNEPSLAFYKKNKAKRLDEWVLHRLEYKEIKLLASEITMLE